MFANRLKNRMKRLTRLRLVRRFCGHDDGAAAVEFALIMVPFLTLLFMIMETALVFFAEETLQTAATDSARLVMTGQAQNFDATAFKNAVCQRIYALFDCANGMYVDVKTFVPGSTIDNSVPLTNGKPTSNFQQGSAGSYVIVRLIYQWPIVVPLVQSFLANSTGDSRLLVATVAFRNEPF